MKIRNDPAGFGYYGAPRGPHRYHKGVDICCVPGDPVLAPIAGKIVRVARPYTGRDLSGVLMRNKELALLLFYFEPTPGLVGEYVRQGQVIGLCQDVTKHYPGQGMTAHLHLQVRDMDPLLLINNRVQSPIGDDSHANTFLRSSSRTFDLRRVRIHGGQP